MAITKERIRAIMWEMLRKKVINIIWTVSMTKYRVLLRLTIQQVDYELRLIRKNLRYRQVHACTPQNFAEIYLRRVDYPNFWPFLDYPTLYPRSMPITLKWGILPYCGSPGLTLPVVKYPSIRVGSSDFFGRDN